ncbi:hypothetical protein [Burkholderia sp. AU45251]|uniref:hypothetical protein n=1 Tax=Burkholderia sp. AU45251 TaxID=3059204 RepID=UPI002652B4A4|nr:hypothetical protein [Burkholderia sp. AU45251]MDN7519102.1 hypothetical protein [Burkholderia sp. AU45251]
MAGSPQITNQVIASYGSKTSYIANGLQLDQVTLNAIRQHMLTWSARGPLRRGRIAPVLRPHCPSNLVSGETRTGQGWSGFVRARKHPPTTGRANQTTV